jgi:hypothetical protein
MNNHHDEQCVEGTEKVPYTDIACFFAIKLENLDWLRDTIIKHSPQAQYLLTGEIATTSHKHSDGEHIHCYWRVPKDMQTGYDAIRNAVKRKFKLVGKASDNAGRQYGKVAKLRDAEKLKQYMLKEQNINMVRTNYINKEELLQYMLTSYKKAKNQEKWQKLQAYAHNLMKKYKKKYDEQNETYTGHNPDPNEYLPQPHFPKLRYLAEVNKYYRSINDGIPLAKNSLIRLSFELGLLDDETYVYNSLKFIMFD